MDDSTRTVTWRWRKLRPWNKIHSAGKIPFTPRGARPENAIWHHSSATGKKKIMSSGLLAFIVLVAAILLYVFIQQNRNTRDKGQDKLINRNVPPYEPDKTVAGGGHDE